MGGDLTTEEIAEYLHSFVQIHADALDETEGGWRIVEKDLADSLGADVGDILPIATDSAQMEASHLPPSVMQRTIEAGKTLAPFGAVRIDNEVVKPLSPPWLEAEAIEIRSSEFVPLYDRTAIVFFMRISVETVSRFETSRFIGVAFDRRTQSELHRLGDTLLGLDPRDSLPTPSEIDGVEDDIHELLPKAEQRVKDKIHEQVIELRKQATVAAEEEIEEAKRAKELQREEIADEIAELETQLNSVLDELSQITGQSRRVELLERRSELNDTLEEKQETLNSIETELEGGLPDLQAEIRERHGLDVRFKPVGVTVVVYEQGNLELSLTTGARHRTLEVPWSLGSVTLEGPDCQQCGEPVTPDRPAVGLRPFICSGCA